MRQLAIGIATIVVAGRLLIGCADGGRTIEQTTPHDYRGISTANLPASRMLDVSPRYGYGAFCYARSLSMMLAHLDPSSTEAEPFTYREFGAVMAWSTLSVGSPCGFVAGARNGNSELDTVTVRTDHGRHWIVASALSSDRFCDMPPGTAREINFADADRALLYLKATVASGRPVHTHLDIGYLRWRCEGAAHETGMCRTLPLGVGHGITIVGYDSAFVYITEVPTSEHSLYVPLFKNARIPLDEFRNAWDNGKLVAGCGPYLIISLEQMSGSHIRLGSAFRTVCAWEG